MHFRARSWTAGDTVADGRQYDLSRRLSVGRNTIQHPQQGIQTGLRALFTNQGKIFFAFLVTWIGFVLYIRVPRAGDAELFHKIAHDAAAQRPSPASLHLLVPAAKADPDLCKIMVSAAIAGYPAPVIINWDQNSDLPKIEDGGAQLAKIQGARDYLDRLDPSQDDDLVLIADGNDIWLQLKPQTLIERFFQINREADARTASRFGEEAMAKSNLRQEIIFGSQKRCSPWKENDPPCYAVPQSPLPKDVFGLQTDTDVGDRENPYVKFRPRFLNSGVVMGTAKAMRNMFQQAVVQFEVGNDRESDQKIFSQMFGDQEVWREIFKQDNSWGLDQKLPSSLQRNKEKDIEFNPRHMEEVRAKAAQRDDGTFEFGIGLDYASEIGLMTADFAEDDTAWLYWNDKANLPQKLNQQQDLGQQLLLSSDILSSPPPFWTFNHDPLLPRSNTWSNVSLLTNLYTAIVPAIIHHDGKKSTSETWWDEIWFHGRTRHMFDAMVYEPIVPIGRSGPNETSQRDYWPSDRRKAGGSAGEMWLRFDDTCRDFHEELFRDGKGIWLMPETH